MVDKWFSLQAVAMHTDVKAVRKLMTHPAFTLKNPNRARSLIFSFCNANPSQFHAADGSGYAFWAEQVIALEQAEPASGRAPGTHAGSLEKIPARATDIIRCNKTRQTGELFWEKTMEVSASLNQKIAQAVQTSMQIEGCKPVQSDAVKKQAQALMEQHRVQVSVHRK